MTIDAEAALFHELGRKTFVDGWRSSRRIRKVDQNPALIPRTNIAEPGPAPVPRSRRRGILPLCDTCYLRCTSETESLDVRSDNRTLAYLR